MTTPVCGYPGAGKSTWVAKHLGNGIAYDLDAMAGAFRLRGPHEEYHDASRHIANDLLGAFIGTAGIYTSEVFIIRTAPTEAEFRQINPDAVVICMRQHVKRPCGSTTMKKLMDIADICADRGIPIEYVF